MTRFEVKGDKRFLVIGRVGDTSIHQQWLQPAEYKNFDLCLSYFGSTPQRYVNDCDFYHEVPGLKWPTVKDTIEAFGDGIYHYDAIWMPDDDISANAYDINRMFKIFMEQGLELAQPSLTLDSYYGHGITLQNSNYYLRYSQFIEPMVPLYTRETFQKLLPTFEKSESGWGLDFVWPKVLGYPHQKLAIIDEVAVKHTRRVGGGELYKNISGSQWDDLYRVTAEYDAAINFRMTHYGGKPKGKRVMFALLAHKDEHVLAAQIENIRKFNPEAGIVLYNGGEDSQFGKGMNAAICEYSRHLTWGHLAPFLWDVMKWLDEHKVNYEYLVNLDDDMLFVKPGFEAYLDQTMRGYDCMGWDMQTCRSVHDADNMNKQSMWEEWGRWGSLFQTDHFVRYFNPTQVYRRGIVKKMLKAADVSLVDQWLSESQVVALEEFFFVTFAASLGGKCREFPRDQRLNVMRHEHEIEQNEAHAAMHHYMYHTIHPVKGDRLLHLHNQLMAGDIPYVDPNPPQPQPQPQPEPSPDVQVRRPLVRRKRVVLKKRLLARKKPMLKKAVGKRKRVLNHKKPLLKKRVKTVKAVKTVKTVKTIKTIRTIKPVKAVIPKKPQSGKKRIQPKVGMKTLSAPGGGWAKPQSTVWSKFGKKVGA
ncbi:hypothetical protein [Paenibacillus sp. WC2504]|uniref:hypothetical protein n=1 Tax=Paenibacillus sp. WC2504 TaxID=3461403 RepID=UPI0040457F85